MKAEDIRIGTSGWHFDDWAGVFYPLRVPRDRWLEYYSARFPVGELNSSYYHLPSAATIRSLQRRTPDDFGVFIKLHGDVTHSRRDFENSVHQLKSATKPLSDCGKLLGYLAQFPSSFRRSTGNEKYVQLIAKHLVPSRLCIEFRDLSWDSDDVRDWFRELSLTWVSPDEPELSGLLPPRLHCTSDIAYIRLHGRNARTWYNSEAGDRYDYNYSESEIIEWAHRLLEFREEQGKGFLFFNNCHLGRAVQNALWLSQWINVRRRLPAEKTDSNDFTLSPT